MAAQPVYDLIDLANPSLSPARPEPAKSRQFGYRKLLYYRGFPGMSTPVFVVSLCSSVKIKGETAVL